MRPLLLAPFVLLLLFAACGDDAGGGQSRQSGAPATAVSGVPAPGGTAGAGGAASGVSTSAVSRVQPAFDPEAIRLGLEPSARGFQSPLFAGHAGDGSGRIFVVEKGGLIRIVRDGQIAGEPFLDLRQLIRAEGSEQGLLGLAFHPRYRENGRFFIAYTARNGDNTVAAYQVSANPERADANSGRVLLAIPDFAANHNGGMLAFGPDGYLYIGTGDGGGGGDPQRNGQKLDALLGKMLRIDVDRGEPYGIPQDNPFVGREGARPEIWAYGLRNPWRYSFDRATGDLYIADVGQNAWEEVNVQAAGSRGGENYGWNRMEGTHCYPANSQCNQDGLVLPILEYATGAVGCSVTGGYVYRGAAFPRLNGAYLYGDYCSGRIWAAYPSSGSWASAELLDSEVAISSFGEDEAGEVYVTDLRSGILYRVTATER